MDTGEIIAQALREGRSLLSEVEAKQVLKAYNIPVVEESVVQTMEEAVAKAKEMGFPVVVKGHGFRLAHKTERGLVRTKIQGEADLLAAFNAIQKAANGDLDGYLIQPHIEGNREFVAGLFRDHQFGAVIMFGLGGIFTEALQDIVFRISPVGPAELKEMIKEIKAQPLLQNFRGQHGVDQGTIIRVFAGLSQLAIDYPAIREIDINPLIASQNGSLIAVDALISIASPSSFAQEKTPVTPRAIYEIFHPRSIAFVGASSVFGKWGNMLLTNVIGSGYQGDVYLVNAKGGRLAGRKVYETVQDIPGNVDLAVVTLPADKVISFLEDFARKGIKKVLLISSGYSETGSIGREKEDALIQKARDLGILILGPNTMGIINPLISFYCTATHIHPKPGTIALLSQSGNFGTQLLSFANDEGIGIRMFCGSGNESMIAIEDYLEGLIADEKTDTVLIYLEGIKDGRRFFHTASRLCQKKPVVLLKGGRSETGNRAAASHTGAMASNTRVFDAACRQAGIIIVENPMELLDLSATFSSLPLPRGNRVAAMTLGGGWGVVMADLCEKYGLEVPPLADDLITRMSRILAPYWSHANPVDMVGDFNPDIPAAILEELMKWDGCDAVIHMGIFGRTPFFQYMVESALKADPDSDRDVLAVVPADVARFEEEFTKYLVNLMDTYKKPIIGIPLIADEKAKTVVEIPGQKYKSISFITPERAVRALAEMSRYRHWLDLRHGGVD